ncbi:MAG: sugar phosphate nucleotidyltransferase, partial [Candidatus Omnitrophica bacterium]|nr:sugar phosphate nucleotidyltransferase [Candidatus Omnitrophota bacterium]
MKIIILAAGYAVRLKPLTIDTPKPLLRIAGRPMLDRIMDKIVSLGGEDEVYLVTNARFASDFEKWAKTCRAKNPIQVINDQTTTNENRLGAIRDLNLVIESASINDDVLVVAGDNLFEFDLNEFLEFSRARPDGVSIALYDIGDKVLARNYGVVAIDEYCRVTDFDEKPP